MSRRVVRHGVAAAFIAATLLSSGGRAADAIDARIDTSVVRALQFLAAEQRPSGAWTVLRYGESTAATGLAIMSFLAAGHVPGEGPYSATIERGVDWVIEHQLASGVLAHPRSHDQMYSHGICTLMLAEVCGMLDASRARSCREALARAVLIILKAQEVPKSLAHAGGWRYQPSSRDSDLSVTGWQLLALRAAKGVGCDVPADNIDAAIRYVKRCSSPGGRGFGYQPGKVGTATRTGTGILALEVCGDHRSEETMVAANFLLNRPLRADDAYFFYGVYYCSIGMFKVGGDYWPPTKANIFDTLLRTQLANGAWVASRGSEKQAGAVYSTSMAVLALCVEYQYLPIYQR